MRRDNNNSSQIFLFENIQHFSFTYIFLWIRKLDSNSLTKTKIWSGRSEVIETSGRLHPVWPQDKRLHTPRTTDYRHSRQDRWIHTELVSTLAKNATKPNPFEIILLQTARKEKNWKTGEALETAVVTLETEQIEGSNPLCLWWWWWWWWWSSLFTCWINSLIKLHNHIKNKTKDIIIIINIRVPKFGKKQ